MSKCDKDNDRFEELAADDVHELEDKDEYEYPEHNIGAFWLESETRTLGDGISEHHYRVWVENKASEDENCIHNVVAIHDVFYVHAFVHQTHDNTTAQVVAAKAEDEELEELVRSLSHVFCH